jgi:hypothetical protein
MINKAMDISQVNTLFIRGTVLEKQSKEEKIKTRVIAHLQNDIISVFSPHKRKPLLIQVMYSMIDYYSPVNNRKDKHV